MKGTRDQPRRMNALGYHVWAIRFCACLFSGLLTAVSAILFVYYTQFISPQTLALTSSAEVLLMVISGGAGTLLGPIVGAGLVVVVKTVVSGFIERWNFLLGAIFVAIVILMPEGLVPGTVRLWRLAGGSVSRQPAARFPAARRQSHERAHYDRLCKSFGGLHVTTDVNLNVEPGERRLIIGPNGAGKTTLFNLITGELDARLRLDPAVRPGHHGRAEPPPRAPRHGAHLSDHHLVRARHHHSQCHAGAAWPFTGAMESDDRPQAARPFRRTRARGSGAGRSRHIANRPLSQTSYGERRRVEIAMALTQNPKVLLLDEPFAGLSIDERRDVQQLLLAIPRDVTIVMIEHNMDVALDFAERITLLHFGEVIVEGNRAEVVADPRTREVYLGH